MLRSYEIKIYGDRFGKTSLTMNFEGGLIKGNADIDYIINIARELKHSLGQLQKLNPENLDVEDKPE